MSQGGGGESADSWGSDGGATGTQPERLREETGATRERRARGPRNKTAHGETRSHNREVSGSTPAAAWGDQGQRAIQRPMHVPRTD